MRKRKGQFLPIFALVILMCSYFLSLSVMQGAREMSKVRVIASYEEVEDMRKMAKSALSASLACQTQRLKDFHTSLKESLHYICSRKPAEIELLSSDYEIGNGTAEAHAKFRIRHIPLKVDEDFEHHVKLVMNITRISLYWLGRVAWKVEIEGFIRDEEKPVLAFRVIKGYYRTTEEERWKELPTTIDKRIDGSFLISSILDEYPVEAKVIVEDLRGIKVEASVPVRW